MSTIRTNLKNSHHIKDPLDLDYFYSQTKSLLIFDAIKKDFIVQRAN